MTEQQQSPKEEMPTSEQVAEFAHQRPPIKQPTVYPTRRLAREKVMQILVCSLISETEWQSLFRSIFPFEYKSDQQIQEQTPQNRLLSPSEVAVIEADIVISWPEHDVIFGKDLTDKATTRGEESDGYLQKFSPDWDISRIAPIDRVLVRMAVAEFLDFPDIPVKVTINEMLELAKRFSTPESHAFINGMLDEIYVLLNEQGKIQKFGRGLVEHSVIR